MQRGLIPYGVPMGDIFGTGMTTTDLTNPVFDQDHNGEVDDVQRGENPFPRAVLAICGLVGALVVVKFLFEKLTD